MTLAAAASPLQDVVAATTIAPVSLAAAAPPLQELMAATTIAPVTLAAAVPPLQVQQLQQTPSPPPQQQQLLLQQLSQQQQQQDILAAFGQLQKDADAVRESMRPASMPPTGVENLDEFGVQLLGKALADVGSSMQVAALGRNPPTALAQTSSVEQLLSDTVNKYGPKDKCSSLACSSGYQLIANADKTDCFHVLCTLASDQATCCQAASAASQDKHWHADLPWFPMALELVSGTSSVDLKQEEFVKDSHAGSTAVSQQLWVMLVAACAAFSF
eukprot:gnl/TRDRNA2_/TRDRNA2_84237_c0_seq2.p1 gnl/TRDRNA2_/TRDRNA2_84237_c0~~gnl/TRDRNA2_/TRDRNA2_84237_c0_seq2.p1  ORF type:complete len:299 (-),score=91.35 gnl/TRDRNA2_/TRDRNA2_84237_c0_seq2:37-855(-)